MTSKSRSIQQTTTRQLPTPTHPLEAMVDAFVAADYHERTPIGRRIAERTTYGYSPAECIEIIINRARLYPRNQGR